MRAREPLEISHLFYQATVYAKLVAARRSIVYWHTHTHRLVAAQIAIMMSPCSIWPQMLNWVLVLSGRSLRAPINIHTLPHSWLDYRRIMPSIKHICVLVSMDTIGHSCSQLLVQTHYRPSSTNQGTSWEWNDNVVYFTRHHTRHFSPIECKWMPTFLFSFWNHLNVCNQNKVTNVMHRCVM